MAVFMTACVAVTVLSIRREPQYVQVISEPRTTAEVDESVVRLNLNTATLEELQMLPGIGEVRARDIVAYREEHGGFLYLEELTYISGIGSATFERLRDLVYIG
jgi:competence protein ComEA